jgi:hypothetical protein
MVITTPTRITIEVTPLQPGEVGQSGQPTASKPVAHIIVAAVDAHESQVPAEYQQAPCHCLDDEDCTADHEHE